MKTHCGENQEYDFIKNIILNNTPVITNWAKSFLKAHYSLSRKAPNFSRHFHAFCSKKLKQHHKIFCENTVWHKNNIKNTTSERIQLLQNNTRVCKWQSSFRSYICALGLVIYSRKFTYHQKIRQI